MIRRRRLIQAAAAGAACSHVSAALAQPAAGKKVLRYAIRIAETGFDPAQVTDLYSRAICNGIFDPLVEFEFLARPYRLRPTTVAVMPEVSAGFTTFTFRLKPGIVFADDAAFKGAKRELVAADYVYSIKRHYDPKVKSQSLYVLETSKMLGLSELRAQALKDKTPFDYDREVEGIRALDRYTLQIKLGEPSPRFLQELVSNAFAAVAREVVEFYGEKIMEHPVGTGPFRLTQWRRASFIALDRNPTYRDEFYDEEAPAGDANAQAAVAANKGKKLPLVDRVEVSIIEENQPRWLAFLNGEHDLLEEVPPDFANLILPNNKLAPNLVKRGIRMVRYPRADVSVSYFNMEDPVVGGYTPDKVALRRAISLGVDVDKEIRLVRRGQAVPSQGPMAPGCYGNIPGVRTEMSEFNRPKAMALLDMYGYVDRDGDGWRERPDGSPLRIEYATQPDAYSRQLIEQWQKNMEAIGVRMEFRAAKWPENLKAANAGKLQMWGVGWSVGAPDGEGFLVLGYGPAKGQSNKARFSLPAFDEAFDKQKRLPDGPERLALMREAERLMIAYMPYKVHVHRIFTDLAQPWVAGYHRNVFTGMGRAWRYVDVDAAGQAAAQS
jgi:ABC-type transport system substrate-binding protein